jgi:hypothetical protein
MKKRAVWFFTALIVVAAGALLLRAMGVQQMELIAEERLDLLASSDGTAHIVGHLESGDRAWVVGCEDIKHYVVIKVKLEQGQVGHLHRGRLHLRRPPASSAWAAPVAWGCLQTTS